MAEVGFSDPFLSPASVAKIFAVSPYTVRNWCKEGKLQGVKINKQWRIQASVVQAFAQSQYGEKND